MRRAAACLIVIFLTLQTACSYLSHFVVVNMSAEAVKVQYRIKAGSKDPFYLTDVPAKTPAPQVSGSKKDWRALNSSEYGLDEGRREVTINLMPGEALRIAIVNGYGTRDEAYETEHFPLEGITISGGSGELGIKGEQVRKAFERQDRSLYTLTYR